MNERLTRKDVCEMLGICYMTLNRYMRAGKITYYKTGERTAKVFFLKQDVLNYLESIKK